jgi:hypothetical protein
MLTADVGVLAEQRETGGEEMQPHVPLMSPRPSVSRLLSTSRSNLALVP